MWAYWYFSQQSWFKQGDNIQPWLTPFPIWNQSVVPRLVLTVASWPAYSFLRRQVRWSGIPIFWKIFQFVGFGIISKAEVDIFLELSFFFSDPMDVGNLISGFSAFSKSSLNIWKFTVHILLKPGLENFAYYFASMCDECNCVVVWALLWNCLSLGMEQKLTFSSSVATAEFSRFVGILSAALSQHHLLGFEIAQLEFHHLH